MKQKSIVLKIIYSVLITLGFVCLFAALWYRRVYGDVGFDSILYTLLNDIGGVQSGLVTGFLLEGLLPALGASLITCFILFFVPKRKFKFYPFARWFYSTVSIVLSLCLIITAAAQVKLIEYIEFISQQTNIYNDEYIDPGSVDITFPEKKRNLIYIMLESMETTFLSKDLGGGLEHDLIPELYALADENINFSQNDGVGGHTALKGSTWTIASIVSQTAAIPLKTPPGITGNKYGKDTFLPGITCFMDVLDKNGYYQAFMVGSDSEFGGRKTYYELHGADKIYDIYTAYDDGIVPDGYHVWWGMEDKYLFEYAKNELLEISKTDEPFAFTMLTADTHHSGGYRCSECGFEYGQLYENVISCASKQVSAFVSWLKQQDFYDNTTVVIVGDHPSMDSAFIEKNVDADYERRVYNCFINSATQPVQEKNRELATIDLFPTTLAAMGCTIDGDRLGLGTNLFSDKPTLLERLGQDYLDTELPKTSDYYTKNFYFK